MDLVFCSFQLGRKSPKHLSKVLGSEITEASSVTIPIFNK